MGCKSSLPIASEAPEVPPEELSVYSNDPSSFKTTDGTAELPIRLASKGPASLPPRTILEVFDKILKEGKGHLPALKQEHDISFSGDASNDASQNPSSWKTWSYQQYYDDCKKVARGFLSLGLDRHASVNIWGFNSPEWFLAEMGAIFAGGKAAGIYPTDTPAQILYKIKHSNGQIVVLEDEKKLLKVTQVVEQLPNVKAIVCWACNPTAEQRAEVPCQLLTWDELLKRGEIAQGAKIPEGDESKKSTGNNSLLESDYGPVGGQELDRVLKTRMEEQKPGHCCALIYTSGTTGQPKAVMISHDSITFEAGVVLQLIQIGKTSDQERLLSYLPLSHVAGMLLDIISPICSTADTLAHTTVHFARPYDLSKGTVGFRLRAVKPTMFLGVPRVWEKIQAKITKIGAATTGLKLKIAMWAKEKGAIHAQNCQLGGSGAFPSNYGIASKLIHAKVKAALGLEKCKFAFTGAAPISVDTLQFFGRLGLQINEVYGMSECTGATTWSTDLCHVWGSCGFAMPGMEVKVFKVNEDGTCGAECELARTVEDREDMYQGEICYRGRHIMMGYMANPDMGEEHVQEIRNKLNSAIDDDGWLHSGDKGIKTVDGMVKITGRYKELLIGAGGENVAPVPIEDAVKAACPVISNIMMFGDRKPFLAAMVTLKSKGDPGLTPGTDELDCEIPGRPEITTISAAMTDKATIEYITACIVEGNKAAPNNNSTIKKFTILPHDFSVEGGELTSTLKLKRSVTLQHFQEVAERTYDPALGRAPYVPFNASGAPANTDTAAAAASVEAKDDTPAEAAPEPVADASAEVPTEPAADTAAETAPLIEAKEEDEAAAETANEPVADASAEVTPEPVAGTTTDAPPAAADSSAAPAPVADAE